MDRPSSITQLIPSATSSRLLLRLLVMLSLPSLALLPSRPTTAAISTQHPFCARLGHTIQASSGAHMYCFGRQPTGPNQRAVHKTGPSNTTNVDAANLSEDISPNGTRAYGQSETSTAAIDQYVVEAWNDATGFFSPCPSASNKEELTGVGFSMDGGTTFTDLGGLPNSNCSTLRLSGDPSVEAYKSGGNDYFYISSLYPNITQNGGPNYLAINACKVTGGTLSCSQPIRAAQSTECHRYVTFTACSFLDKEFLTIDPVRGRLYLSYTDFGVTRPTSKISLAVCDIGTPAGGVGPAGGTAAAPVCTQPKSTGTPSTYFVVDPGTEPCENEGAYPAVDKKTGDVYVAWEYNWATNTFGPPPCSSAPVRNIVAHVPFSCLRLTATSPCRGPDVSTNVTITSMDAASIPGYNRFPMSDFPRIAVSDPKGTVSIVWNDAGTNPAGDIVLQSFGLGSLAPVQFSPVRLNTGPLFKWHFLPALRYPTANGNLDVSWYDRRLGTGAQTDVFAATNVDPRATGSPMSNVQITNVSSDWNAVSSDIVPNFGDYTDNYINSSTNQLYVAWSDGRYGVPQPFNAHRAS